jgi:hypothetical protein
MQLGHNMMLIFSHITMESFRSKTKKRKVFEPESLYIEMYPPPYSPKKEEVKEEKEERGFVIIDL